jgi:hypothetical protein
MGVINHVKSVNRLPKSATLLHGAIVMLFFLGNAGFTAVIHSCVMQSSGCQCSGNPHDTMCESSQASSHGPALKDEVACHVKFVGGGLPNLQALHEQVHGEKASRVILTLNTILASSQESELLTSVAIRSSFFVDSSPLSGEKYVLHEALLI